MKNERIPVITLDKTGRSELDKEIEKLEEILAKLKNRNKNTKSGDEWDALEAKDIAREESYIKAEIRRLRNILSNIVVVDVKEAVEHNVIDLDDVVELNLIFDEDDAELMLVRLGAVRKNDTEDGIPVISVESPLGAAIYKQEVGKTVSYAVNKVLCKAEILNKVDENVKEVEGKKTK